MDDLKETISHIPGSRWILKGLEEMICGEEWEGHQQVLLYS